MIYSGKTDIGKVRTNNQDSFAIKRFSENTLVAIVCDGMGGARGGNIASETAVECFLKNFDDKSIIDLENPESITPDTAAAALAHAVFDANHAVYVKSISDSALSGMGTTLAACIIVGNTMYVANVGDSRLYVDSGKKLIQITQDHSYVQFLIDVGNITPDEAKNHPYRNRITRAIGIQPEVDCDIFTVNLAKYQNPKVLICSDGLCGQVEDTVMHEITASAYKGRTLKQDKLDNAVNALINAALDNGGPDNITAVLISVKES